MSEHQKVKRKIYLINTPFQLKFSLYICFFVLIASLPYPFAIYSMMTNFITQMAKHDPNVLANLGAKKEALLIILFTWQTGLILLTFIASIFISHKIAGPIYKTIKWLGSYRNNNSQFKLTYRKGDHFNELANEINTTFQSVDEKYRNDFVYLSEVATYIEGLSAYLPDEKKQTIKDIKDRLFEIQHRFHIN